MHDMMRNESYIRTHRISTITRLHAQCSYDENCVATASLLLGIFFGLILYHISKVDGGAVAHMKEYLQWMSMFLGMDLVWLITGLSYVKS